MALAAIVAVSGCSRDAPPPFPDHLEGYLSESPQAGFALLLDVSRAAEEDGAALVARINWTPDKRQAATKAAQRAISIFDQINTDEFVFVYSPASPLTSRAERRGWRFVGRALVWRIEESVLSKDYDAAIADFDRVMRFGTILSGGDAIDANLGFVIIAEAREELWPAFPMMTAEQLRRVHQSIVRALSHAPTPQVVLRHEKAAMLKSVEAIQEAFLAGDLKPFRDALGETISPAIEYLNNLKKKPVEEQVSYFERFGREANEEAQAALEEAAISPHLWQDPSEPKGERPWFRFANHYFRNSRFFLRDWARHQAWMRLTAIDAALLARVKAKGNLPADLSGLQDWLRTDPFSGADFVYVPQGVDYRLYGVGEDRKNDFGDAKVDMAPIWM